MSTERPFYTSKQITKTLLDAGNSRVEADIAFNAEHELYQGHFPGNPITPGVCLVQSINDLVTSQFNGVDVAEVKKCKFTAIHNPNVVPVVRATIDISNLEGTVKVTASLKSETETFVKYSAIFQ